MCQEDLYFVYDKKLFRQINGLGMGTNYSPSASNLTLWVIEFNNQMIIKRCIFFARYIDDIFVIIYEKHIKILNFKQIYPQYLEFDTKMDENTCNFLDLTIKITKNKQTYDINTELYEKELGSTQYIHSQSNHPEFIKNNILYGMLYRAILRFSNENQFEAYKRKLYDKMLSRGAWVPKFEASTFGHDWTRSSTRLDTRLDTNRTRSSAMGHDRRLDCSPIGVQSESNRTSPTVSKWTDGTRLDTLLCFFHFF